MKRSLNNKEVTSPTPAGQFLRDRLNQLKATQQGNKPAGARGNAPLNMSNRFQNSSPRNMSQKTRKGLRPG